MSSVLTTEPVGYGTDNVYPNFGGYFVKVNCKFCILSFIICTSLFCDFYKLSVQYEPNNDELCVSYCWKMMAGTNYIKSYKSSKYRVNKEKS